MGANEVLQLQIDELEKKAKMRGWWYTGVVITMLGWIFAARGGPIANIFMLAVFVMFVAFSVSAESAGKKAKLLRAQLA